MPSHQITVTGPIGPGKTLTSKPFTDIKRLNFDLEKQVLEIEYGPNRQISHIDLYTIATITYTIATRVATVTVST